MLELLKQELHTNREQADRNTQAVQKAIAGLSELIARTASMDHRVEAAHAKMGTDLNALLILAQAKLH